MKILYCEDDDTLREYVGFLLEGDLGLSVIEATNAKIGIDILKADNLKEIQLIISDYDMPVMTGKDLYDWVSVNRSEIPIIFISGALPEDFAKMVKSRKDVPVTYCIQKPFDPDDVINTVEQCGFFRKRKMGIQYVPINIFRLLRFSAWKCDLFIKLSNQKYVKILDKNDFYDNETICKYLDKSVTEFFVTNEDYVLFIQESINTIFHRLNSINEDINSDIEVSSHEKFSTQLAAVNVVQNKVVQLGLDKSIIELMDKTVETCLISLKKDERINSMIQKIMRGTSYIYEQSLLCTYLVADMAKSMSWSSKEIYDKLCFASLLHNVCLQNDQAAMLEFKLPHEMSEKERGEFEKIKDHPLQAAKIVKNCKNLPLGLEVIIAQHHERPDSQGYPQKLSYHQIAPLAALFIVADDFSSRIYQREVTHEVVGSILMQMKEVFYKAVNFKRPFDALCKSLRRTEFIDDNS
jgi:response regulator RpfG family c-di-GMP phosphodiesterase